MPNEDAEDYIIIKNNLKNIEKFNFEKILKKYNSENYIIQIVFIEKNKIKFYSKINFDDKFLVINKDFINKNLQIQSDLDSMILNIKKNYEDKWKSINKMSPSTSVPIRLFVESKKIHKTLKLENILDTLDFVSNYKIERFDSSEIVYKVSYTGNPKRFLKEILDHDIIIDTTSPNWKIK